MHYIVEMVVLADSPESICVMVVDDHHLVLDALCAALDLQPTIEVVGKADTLEEAKELLAEARPAVVVIDAKLVSGDAGGIVAAIESVGLPARVLALSESGSVQTLRSVLRSGCGGIIQTSAPLEDLVAAIHQLHAGEAIFPVDALRAVSLSAKSEAAPVGSNLTDREIEILEHLTEAHTTAMIAEELFLSAHTVRNHLQSIFNKLSVSSQLEAVVKAVGYGIVEIDIREPVIELVDQDEEFDGDSETTALDQDEDLVEATT